MRLSDSVKPPFPYWQWIRPICLGDAGWLQSPDKRPQNLANFSWRWRILPKQAGNCARNNNGKRPAPDVSPAGLAVVEALLRLQRALLLSARESDQKCDTSSLRPTPMLQRLRQNLDRAWSLSQKVAQPFRCRCAIDPDA